MNKIGVTFFNGKYEEYIEYKEKKRNIDFVLEEENTKAKSKTNNTYFKAKEEQKRQNKIKKIENEIEQKENEIKKLKEEMQNENICTDYIKLKELQENIEILEKEIEEKMEEWEKLNQNSYI